MAKANTSQSVSRNTRDAATPTVLPRPDFHFRGEIGRTYLDSEPEQFPQPIFAYNASHAPRQNRPAKYSRISKHSLPTLRP